MIILMHRVSTLYSSIPPIMSMGKIFIRWGLNCFRSNHQNEEATWILNMCYVRSSSLCCMDAFSAKIHTFGIIKRSVCGSSISETCTSKKNVFYPFILCPQIFCQLLHDVRYFLVESNLLLPQEVCHFHSFSFSSVSSDIEDAILCHCWSYIFIP